ncbi:MAG: hypothetical protein KDA91_15740 [Planctomycetaceae bacterium]|nr:hypothetical protein [Planctomycetaceae bacterium]
MNCELTIIGNDKSAFEMADVATAAGKQTLVVLPEARHSAWMTAQALRHIVTNLMVDATFARRQLMKSLATPKLLKRMVMRALTEQTYLAIDRLDAIGACVIPGEARFVSSRELSISTGINCGQRSVVSDNIVIATGVRHTATHRPLGLMPFHRPESLFEGQTLPRTLTIVGGNEPGAGLAALFSMFGVQTRLLTQDSESNMVELAEDAGVEVITLATNFEDLADELVKPASLDVVDFRREVGFTDHLNLPCIGVETDENGRLWCNSSLETWTTGVFGIGEVVGFSSEPPASSFRQASRILNRITHRIPRPNFLRSPAAIHRTAGY